MNISDIENKFLQSSTGDEYSSDRLIKMRNMIEGSGKLLDIGIWNPKTIALIQETFKGEVFGIDVSESIVDMVREHYSEAKVCDLNSDQIPFQDNFFDVVLCGEVIEHIFDTDRMLLEINRILKPGGHLILSTPNLSSFVNRLFILCGLQPLSTEVSNISTSYGNPLRKKGLQPSGHIRNFTFRAMKDIIAANGFTLIEAKPSAITTFKPILFLEQITQKLSVSFGSDIILKCEKR